MTHLVPDGSVSTKFVPEVAIKHTLQQLTPVLSYPVPRPTTGFPYPNQWGSAFVLLLPFVAIVYGLASHFAVRAGMAVLLGLSSVPPVFSLSRVAWLSLGSGWG